MQAEFVFLAPYFHGDAVFLPYRAVTENKSYEFTEKITLPAELQAATAPTTTPILRLLSFAAGLSYYKAFAPTKISVPKGLTAKERDFLSTIIAGGLGEFAYVNQLPNALTPEIIAPEITNTDLHSVNLTALDAIAHTNTAVVHTSEANSLLKTHPDVNTTRALVAIGGGKDSIVSLMALKNAGIKVTGFAINPKPPMINTAKVAEVALLTANRRLDPLLLELNKQGYPNGHVPVTAINSCIALLSAIATGHNAVVFSNEAGSSYGNLSWSGKHINHQWSKSSEFEKLLRDNLPTNSPNYFSLLRPLNEIRIAKNFAQARKFHSVFTSCNRAFTLNSADTSSWCANCPKCRFIFLMLAAFLDPHELTVIFNGKNMFDDATQHEGFIDLMGKTARLKPFECVGEPLECKVALQLAKANPKWQKAALFAHPEIAEISVSQAEIAAAFALQNEQHFVPENLWEIVNAI